MTNATPKACHSHAAMSGYFAIELRDSQSNARKLRAATLAIALSTRQLERQIDRLGRSLERGR